MSDSKHSRKRSSPPISRGGDGGGGGGGVDSADDATESPAKRARPPPPERAPVAAAADDDDKEVKDEGEEQEEKWSEAEVKDVVEMMLMVSKTCLKTLRNRQSRGAAPSSEESEGFDQAIRRMYDWLSANFVIACRFKMGTQAFEEEAAGEPIEDVVDVSEEDRQDGAPIRLSLMEMLMITIAQCMQCSTESGEKMDAACARFDQACIQARAAPRLSNDEKISALRHRIAREIFTYHHSWRVAIDYKLTSKIAMRKHSELYEFEMNERELADFYRRNPQYLEERKRLDAQPKPYLYRDQISEQERKANLALDIIWGLSMDDLQWVCVSKLAACGAVKLTRELTDFIHASAWFVFHSNFCAQLWGMYKHVPLVMERQRLLLQMRAKLVGMITEQLAFDRDAEMRDSSQVFAFRLTAPVGTCEYFAGNNEFDVDRHHVKLQKICNWLEPTKQLQEAWLASIAAIGDLAPATVLLQTPSAANGQGTTLESEVHFYQSFATMVKFQCQIDLDRHVLFGADVLARYHLLWKHRDYEVPLRETRPQIVSFAKQFAVRIRNEFHECKHLWQACLLWLVLMEEQFYGKTSEELTTHRLARSLGVPVRDEPVPACVRGRYGGPPPAQVGAGENE